METGDDGGARRIEPHLHVARGRGLCLPQSVDDRTRCTHHDARGTGLQIGNCLLANRPHHVDLFGAVSLGRVGLLRVQRVDGERFSVLLHGDVHAGEDAAGRLHHQLDGSGPPKEFSWLADFDRWP